MACGSLVERQVELPAYPLHSLPGCVLLDTTWRFWSRHDRVEGVVDAIAPESGVNLLWLAVEQMDIPMIRRLGELGADPNCQLTGSAITAVHNAVDVDIDSVMQSEQPANPSDLTRIVTFAVTQAMVAIGGSIHVADGSGKTPYQIACGYHPSLGAKLLAIMDG